MRMAHCSLLLLTSSKKLVRFIRFIVEGGFVNQLRRFISSGSRFKGAASSITIVSSTPLYSSNAHCIAIIIIIIIIIMIGLASSYRWGIIICKYQWSDGDDYDGVEDALPCDYCDRIWGWDPCKECKNLPWTQIGLYAKLLRSAQCRSLHTIRCKTSSATPNHKASPTHPPLCTDTHTWKCHNREMSKIVHHVDHHLQMLNISVASDAERPVDVIGVSNLVPSSLRDVKNSTHFTQMRKFRNCSTPNWSV